MALINSGARVGFSRDEVEVLIAKLQRVLDQSPEDTLFAFEVTVGYQKKSSSPTFVGVQLEPVESDHFFPDDIPVLFS